MIDGTNQGECSKTKYAHDQNYILSVFYCSKARAQLAPSWFFFSF